MNGFFQSDLKLGIKKYPNCKSAAKAKESPEKALGIISCGESLPARLNLGKEAEKKIRIYFHHERWGGWGGQVPNYICKVYIFYSFSIYMPDIHLK